MKRKFFWITLSLINLCIVALLGATLRTKLLFPVPFIDYKNFLSAHSHFAFGGWVTLALMILYIDNLLTPEQKQKNIYQWMLWGIEISSLGMVLSFPFRGYAFFSILFSTVFIFFSYGFSWIFIRDILRSKKEKVVKLLSVSALLSLIVSSAGPFTLAYILATKTGDAILYRDSIYFYLHFQYNGFFTLSVFALLFNRYSANHREGINGKFRQFAFLLCLSVIPGFFLTLLWHADNIYVRILAITGCILILLTLSRLLTFVFNNRMYAIYNAQLARMLVAFSMIAFALKMILQMGTIVPALGNAVFGYRPIIIGFLHLVFLGLVSFYILANFWEDKLFPEDKKISGIAVLFFSGAVILNETILLVDGIGLMLSTTHPVYPWLLWIAALLLFTGAILMLGARLLKSVDGATIRHAL